MKTSKLKLYITAICVSLLLPSLSSAYFTTDQSATRLTSDTILFTVSYTFGHSDRELYMPIGAMRGIDTKSNSPYAGYTVLNDDEVTEEGTTSAIVLTKNKSVEIKDNQYFLPAGKRAEFTLVTLLSIPESEQNNSDDLSLIMSNLPFTMIDEGTEFAARLNPSELQYYVTPSIELGE
jgi:hypothetical protein